LILEFWPDSPRNKSTSQLQSTLYDARRTVGSEVLIYQASQESYQLNPEAQIWYDVAEFENALALAAERGPGRERARYLRQAIDLYTGPYLVDINTNWAGERRNELDTAFLQGVIDLGDCYLAERDFGEAHKWYQQALKIDNYREDVHRRIMLALASHGRKAEALRHYQHCVQILNDELGVAPDPATRALARKIQSS
jgi:DNA-binding SARP family transcriptional activator